MNKNELVEYIAQRCDAGVSKTLITEVLDLGFEGIQNTLKNGEEVKFVGFGTFKVSRREATTGRNPRTGAEIKIEAANRVKFSPGKELKQAVNG